MFFKGLDSILVILILFLAKWFKMLKSAPGLSFTPNNNEVLSFRLFCGISCPITRNLVTLSVLSSIPRARMLSLYVLEAASPAIAAEVRCRAANSDALAVLDTS